MANKELSLSHSHITPSPAGWVLQVENFNHSMTKQPKPCRGIVTKNRSKPMIENSDNQNHILFVRQMSSMCHKYL